LHLWEFQNLLFMKTKNPVFSIITCTLNSELFLKKCLNSIFSQNFDDFEVIVVDGGSIDSTLSIVSAFPKIKLIENIGGGISNAMNTGIVNASGKIISILHSDDYYYDKNTLKTVFCSFQANHDKKWLFGNVARSELGGISLLYNDKYNFRYFQFTSNIPHPGVFIKRDLYESIKLYDVKLKYAMDYDLLLRISKISEPIQIFEFLAVFRVHNGSLSSKHWKKARNEALFVQLRNADSIYFKLLGIYRYIKTRLKKILMKND